MSSVQDLRDIAGLVIDVRHQLNLQLEQLAAELRLSDEELERLELGDTVPATSEVLRRLVALALRHHLQKLLLAHGLAVPPFDHLQDFWANFNHGPWSVVQPPDRPLARRPTKLLDFELGFPFGVPACALIPNSKFVRFYAQQGFDLLTYKTVRDRPWPTHPFPNWAFVPSMTQPISLGDVDTPVVGEFDYWPPDRSTVSMVNSYGVPSLQPDEWQADVERSKRFLGPGQVLIVSVMGTPEQAATMGALAEQFAKAAVLAQEAGAHIIELNLSCPNTRGGLICQSPEATRAVTKAVKDRLAGTGTPIFIKLSSLSSELEEVITSAADYIQGIVAINTVSIPVNGEDGMPLFEGEDRRRAGLSGVAIRQIGLDFAQRLVQLREQKQHDAAIIGVGGVMSSTDFDAYLDIGVDAVQSCTGAWINPDLAIQIRGFESSDTLKRDNEREEVIIIEREQNIDNSLKAEGNKGGLVVLDALYDSYAKQLAAYIQREDLTPFHRNELEQELQEVNRERATTERQREDDGAKRKPR